jgi:hypothetical protein
MQMYGVYYQQQEEGKAQLRQRLSDDAVNLAIQGRWEEAEALNRDIIEKFPTDAEAYNRLGRALTELGDFERARQAYAKAVELAPENAIARRNLARLTAMSESLTGASQNPQKTAAGRVQARRVALDLFVTEMGKAGVVNLHNVAPRNLLAKIGFGDQVRLDTRGQHLIVKSESGDYLGEVEPRQASRLVKLMRGGNRYDAAMLSAGEDRVQVIIKEVYQHPSQVGYPSFPVKAGEQVRTRIREGLLTRGIPADESDVLSERADFEEEDYTDHEEEPLPEGFTVVSEDSERGTEI